MKKILFISQYFYPENFRGNDIAFDLARDHHVHVVCGTPNYPEGKFFPGYGWFKRSHETVNGVDVTRLPIIPRGHHSITLALNYFSFMAVAWLYILFHSIRHRYDCVFVQQLSPVMMSSPGILYKRLRHVPLYTWVLDLWPESLEAAGKISNKFVLSYFARFAAREYRWSDKILISSNSFRNSILAYGNYGDKIVYYPQWAEDALTLSHGSSRIIPKFPDGFKVMFAGNIGEAQGFDQIMIAAKLCADRDDIKWLIVGDGRKLEFVRETILENHLENTVFTFGRFPLEAMPSFFSSADIMLVTLKDEPLFRLTAPAKIQAYMASSKPILAMISGEGANIIEQSDCGFSVPAGDAMGLASMVRSVADMPADYLREKGENGHRYYEKHFRKAECLYALRAMLPNNLNPTLPAAH